MQTGIPRVITICMVVNFQNLYMLTTIHAAVVLSFNYEDKLIGTIEISMIREGGEWKVDSIEFPKFTEINW